MWIGEELVEADVVEKQRAREIYETILRERRDPGLLEGSGGNLCKTLVYCWAGLLNLWFHFSFQRTWVRSPVSSNCMLAPNVSTSFKAPKVGSSLS